MIRTGLVAPCCQWGMDMDNHTVLPIARDDHMRITDMGTS